MLLWSHLARRGSIAVRHRLKIAVSALLHSKDTRVSFMHHPLLAGPEVTRGRVEELDSTLSAPASLEGPEVAGAIRALAGIDPPRPMSEAGEGRWGRSRPPQQLAPAGTSLERIRNWNVESLEHRAALQSEHRYRFTPMLTLIDAAS